MLNLTLPLHSELQSASRLESVRSLLPVMSRLEWAILMGMGVLAAVMSTALDFNLRIPGHAILRAVFPMAAGLATVPRTGGGTVMGLCAGLTVLPLHLLGWVGHGGGVGALTSLLVIGPCLDVALCGARSGWQIWLSFALSGVAANGLAFVARGGSKRATGLPTAFGDWLQRAPLSYLTCGLVAGLLSGMVWFAVRRRGQPASNSPAVSTTDELP